MQRMALFSYRIPLVLFFAVSQEGSEESGEFASCRTTEKFLDSREWYYERNAIATFPRNLSKRSERRKDCSCNELIYFLVATNNKEHESDLLQREFHARHVYRENLVKIHIKPIICLAIKCKKNGCNLYNFLIFIMSFLSIIALGCCISRGNICSDTRYNFAFQFCGN